MELPGPVRLIATAVPKIRCD